MLKKTSKLDYNIEESADHLDELMGFKKYSVRALPLESIELDGVRTEKMFVSTKRLQPIFRDTCGCPDDVAIKLEKSFIDM